MKDSKFHSVRVFQFLTELSADDPNLQDDIAGPILRAAQRVMRHAHTDPKTGALVSRKKIDPSIPYITHPIMVYHMLAAMGETDGVVLAAALLHDALEDCDAFKHDHDAMQRMLVQELVAEGVDASEAATVAGDIVKLCVQVKNDPMRMENKLASQIREIPFMSHEAKIMKIADQTASLIDHLMMPNDPALIPRHDSVDFASKAQNITRAIVHFATTFEQGKPRRVSVSKKRELAKWYDLARDVQHLNHRLLRTETPEQDEQARERFTSRQNHLFKNSRKLPHAIDDLGKLDVRDAEVQLSYEFSKRPTPDKALPDNLQSPLHSGISRIALNERNEVLRFTCWVAPTDAPSHPRNVKAKMVSNLMAHHRQVHMDDSQLHSVWFEGSDKPVMEGRRHIFDLPMALDKFLELALHADGITDQDAEHVKTMVATQNLFRYRDVAIATLGSGRDTPGR